MIERIWHCVHTGIMIVLFCCCAVGATWTWKTETVDRTGAFTNIAVDNSGGIHIGYMSGSGLTYAYRGLHTSKWLVQTINTGGEWVGLALDMKGFPHFCFGTTGARLIYEFLNETGWHSQQIAPGLGGIGYTCSVGITPDGTVNLFWYQINSPSGDFYHLRHAELKDGAWLTRTVDMAAETGKWNSATVDGTGKLHIAYSTYEDAELRHAYFDGKNWEKDVVDSRILSKGAMHPFLGNSIVVRKDGTVQISYEDDDQLKVATQSGDHWQIKVIDTLSPRATWWALHTSQAIDDNGYAHVVYQDAGALKHAYQDADGWHIQILAPGGADPFRFGNMAVGPDNTLYVVYRDPNTTAVTLAIGKFTVDKTTQRKAPDPNELKPAVSKSQKTSSPKE